MFSYSVNVQKGICTQTDFGMRAEVSDQATLRLGPGPVLPVLDSCGS